ncbi:hypothetical protein BAUCODRAFT_29699 [Baudoinia panamericana UAMH 10762]|uniref:Zn(2)-C6 fungal-type domain-containing protein n=1 Tax=Baudoinia panamericana (strain UAMH 10762) TaxID=717646 RepID=M2NNX9_BAUPA|nr:uncharacterized protein BAUCODRAFT_29699 [Baudoinia panamericana UAMH 10762]EMD01250.1 hypothetical protein BAUCODRAFT_29699 [Baudoinia panamericana UAMH 10762]
MDAFGVEAGLSESSASPEDTTTAQMLPPKRTADAAGLKPGMRSAKSVKRRASKACQCCRSRKVRCNVVEHGAPCTNCRLDEVECIVSESKRKKKWSSNDAEASPQQSNSLMTKENGTTVPMSARPPYEPLKKSIDHTPHSLYQGLEGDGNAADAASQSSLYTPNMLMNLHRHGQRSGSVAESAQIHPDLLAPMTPPSTMPLYIKAMPTRISPDDLAYLERRGALTIPPTPLRNELLRSYAEFIHPYMPLLNIHEFVQAIDGKNDSQTISLLLFQAVMFAGIASVDMRYLKAAGYDNRRDARREFFQKTRLLYDFDIEVDRISLIQSLLLMTYWYETPDDQKDSHHWMGIAVSLSHTIGLHRNPEKSASMDVPRQKLWKRIWWSTYMRDRLVALGMRRPTRIKDADFDVPMLRIDDFEDNIILEGPSCIPADCSLLRDRTKQRQLAVMCIEKAKLCICISHVLSVQYSVLHNNHGVLSDEGSTRTTMMLVAKRLDPEVNEVQACDQELQDWKQALAEDAQYVAPTWAEVDVGNADIALNRSLLHMIYYATLSALHRPQVLPSTALPPRSTPSEQLEISRKAVRLAAGEITNIANGLYHLDLVKYLPSTGITVLLPAIIIHLLDIKAPDEATRRASLQGFCQCMRIMARLRDVYAAADYSTAFLEAAIKKAEISLPQKSNEVKDSRSIITSAQGLMELGRRMTSGMNSRALTPPPDAQQDLHSGIDQQPHLTDEDIAHRLNTFLASSPPNSDHQPSHHEHKLIDDGSISIPVDLEADFDSLVNLDAAGETWLLEDSAYAAMQGGESSGFTMDMDWMQSMKDGGLAIPMGLD